MINLKNYCLILFVFILLFTGCHSDNKEPRTSADEINSDMEITLSKTLENTFDSSKKEDQLIISELLSEINSINPKIYQENPRLSEMLEQFFTDDNLYKVSYAGYCVTIIPYAEKESILLISNQNDIPSKLIYADIMPRIEYIRDVTYSSDVRLFEITTYWQTASFQEQKVKIIAIDENNRVSVVFDYITIQSQSGNRIYTPIILIESYLSENEKLTILTYRRQDEKSDLILENTYIWNDKERVFETN